MKRLLLTAAAVATTLLSVGGVAGATAPNKYPIKQAAVVTTNAPAPKTVTVLEGDYLSKIATANDTTYLRLFYANEKISNPDLIYPGDNVRVPEASETLAARDLPTNVPVEVQQQVAENPAADTQPVTQQPAAVVPQPVRPRVNAPAVADGSVWDRLAACESGGNWAINTGNGFYGGIQFTLSSWAAVGGTGYPNQASREEQIQRGIALQARQGWGAWPACSAKLGLY